MEIGIKINNVLVDNVVFTEKGENEIHTENFKEEFFGVYNVGIGKKNIICEGSSENYVNCNVLVKEFLLENLFEKVPFRIIDSNRNKIVINKNLFLGNSPKIKKVKQVDVYEELQSNLKENFKTKQELEYLLEKSEKEKNNIAGEIQILKEQIHNIENKRQVITEQVVPSGFQNYKQELLNEFFRITNENENIIEGKLNLIESSLNEQVSEKIEESLDFFKNENENALRHIINEFYQEISETTKNEIESFKDILKEESSLLEEKYDSKVKEQIDLYSEINAKLFESVNSAKKDTENVLSEQIEKSKKKLLESFEIAINKQKEDFLEYSEINKKLFEGVSETKKEMENVLSEQIEKSKQILLESLQKHKEEFANAFVSKFEKIIKDKEEEIKNKTENILEQHDKNFISFAENKKKEMENISSEIVTEANKKIKDLEKKVETLSNQLNKSNTEKKTMENLLQESRSYTDRKMNQMLEESKKFTRIMMDFVGGGSGSVAVQYAAGGTINGDLNVAGSANVNELNTAGAILSGGTDLTEIFAGEGGGDSNVLDGGVV